MVKPFQWIYNFSHINIRDIISAITSSLVVPLFHYLEIIKMIDSQQNEGDELFSWTCISEYLPTALTHPKSNLYLYAKDLFMKDIDKSHRLPFFSLWAGYSKSYRFISFFLERFISFAEDLSLLENIKSSYRPPALHPLIKFLSCPKP